MRRILHLFPGQGIQKVGMHASLDSHQYLNLVKYVPGLQKCIEEGPQAILNQTEFTQPAIFICSYLRYQQIPDAEIQYAIGHSVGEYAALTIAGHLDPQETVQLLYKRGCIMRDCSKGRQMGMLAVASTQDFTQIVQKVLVKNQIIEPALYNSQNQLVYSGDKESLKLMQAELKKQKVNSLFLEVSAAFHCSLLSQGKLEFEKELQKYVKFNPKSEIKVIRNIDATVYENRDQVIEGLRDQLDHPVMFQQSYQKIKDLNLQCIEYGSNILTKFLS
ncbi:unnamed protein product (macronuclear) [Paramecium tetraurelia]|uniref:[acyl-carrier-protein] S-malonyltransferase n=1 Tax=Paramecium tetraurelia TaxID=5888 RepID=A0BGY1_PARTE|nr:uncharacterized protein GSPATT00028833001 [Paramecium tetraurelia]CAK57798.1 unnamed protein product [Paramecium tetraurelia]|eukprot:XP_001425196.1 hypothetical protein (macronuclear) [Paramecium tetraurelia strain d4-2]